MKSEEQLVWNDAGKPGVGILILELTRVKLCVKQEDKRGCLLTTGMDEKT